jgi:nucleoside phosphorylase
MGMTAACVTACKAVERWRPRFLVMTGIAAGTQKKQNHGDILVAEAAYDYGSGKICENAGGKRTFIPSPSQLRIDPELQAILQRWEREQLQMDVIRKAWYSVQPTSPKLILGVLATGAAVVQDKKHVLDIMSKSRKVVGLDMEAYAVFQASHLARAPRPRILVAKSVSDFADKRKKDDWQQYAAFTSARFIYEFFTKATELKIGSITPD